MSGAMTFRMEENHNGGQTSNEGRRGDESSKFSFVAKIKIQVKGTDDERTSEGYGRNIDAWKNT